MTIRFGEWILEDIKIENEEYNYSKIYDIELHKFDIQIKVKGRFLENFKKVVEECSDGGIFKLDDENKIIGEYKFHSKSFCYSGNKFNEDTFYNCYLSLEEVVNKKIEK